MKERAGIPKKSRNLYDVPPAELESLVGTVVGVPFRARQIAKWLYERGVTSFDSMSNIPLDERASLKAQFEVSFPAVASRTEPGADASQKYLFSLEDGNLIEAVYMPMGDRTTVCVSSQAGCAVGCTFCVTGYFGAGRNLSPSEITGQVFTIRNEKQLANGQLNVVFMGMGEPLLNFESVSAALDILYRTLSPKRITLSTSGIIPGIVALGQLPDRPQLAVSINAPDDERREQIMPITRKYPLGDLVDSLHEFPLERGRSITAEYVLLSGFNDAPADAELLSRLLRKLRVKVNVIPFNPDPNLPAWMKRPVDARIDRFADVLVRRGMTITVRRSKGNDIAAACGQLRGRSERLRDLHRATS